MEMKRKSWQLTPKRQNITQGLVAVFGFRDDQTCQKGPQGQRETGLGRQPGH